MISHSYSCNSIRTSKARHTSHCRTSPSPLLSLLPCPPHRAVDAATVVENFSVSIPVSSRRLSPSPSRRRSSLSLRVSLSIPRVRLYSPSAAFPRAPLSCAVSFSFFVVVAITSLFSHSPLFARILLG